MNTDFCHIAPVSHLESVAGRDCHLVLAHLVETNQKYVDWYLEQKEMTDCRIILDNSAFEMYKQGKSMYPSDKLIELGKKIDADYIVMSDYPDQDYQDTIDAAIKMAPEIKNEGIGTFFVPQSEIGDLSGLVQSFKWAAANPDIVDYIGVSILAVPNAYGVEKENNLQRYVSRFMFLDLIGGQLLIYKHNRQKVHLLGMVDGPNEILLLKQYMRLIESWDSSSAVWAGINDVLYDNSPTGLINGKIETEVDFDIPFNESVEGKIAYNMTWIDNNILETL